jgi:hypothetical protein
MAYCSTQCQEKHWKTHKPVCKLLKKFSTATVETLTNQDIDENTLIRYDLLPMTNACESLPGLIKKSILSGCIFTVYSSYADQYPNTELVEIPEIVNLFRNACENKGLLHFMEYQRLLFNNDDIIVDNIALIRNITCGKIIMKSKDKKYCQYILDNPKLRRLEEKSIESFNRLYADTFTTSNNTKTSN